MVIIKILGGLGNQMFQYAAAKALSYERNDSLYLDTNAFKTNYKFRNYDLKYFNIKEKHISLNKLRIIYYLAKINIGFKIYKEPNFEFQQDFFHVKAKNIYLNGYFQSEKYFKNIEDSLRKDFEVITPLSLPSSKMLEIIKNVNSVSLHVRRGDYVSNPKANQVFGTCSLNYYKGAIEIIKQKVSNAHFFVFSDDIEWARKNIEVGSSKVNFIDFNDSSKNYEDMELMKNCKHNIIANSSFSWWGAWLNENKFKIVLAPQKWFSSEDYNTDDLLPKSWMRI